MREASGWPVRQDPETLRHARPGSASGLSVCQQQGSTITAIGRVYPIPQIPHAEHRISCDLHPRRHRHGQWGS